MVTLTSPLGWVGGKFKMTNILLPIIQAHPHTTYVEPFAGGASVFFKKQPSTKEVLNDINPDLIEFYRKTQKKAESCLVYNTPEEYQTARQNVESGTWTACDFIRYNKNTFAGNMKNFGLITDCNHQDGSCHISKYNQTYSLIEQRLKNVKLHNQDYQEMIQTYDSPDTFFYADPPYDVTSSKYYQHTNLSAVSPEKIAENFSNIQGKVLITFNDSPRVRQAFEKYGYHMKNIALTYSANNNFARKPKNELLITNFKT